MFVCVCVHAQSCTYVHACIHTYIHTYIHATYIHTYTHTFIHTYIHKHIHTYTQTYIHTYIHTYMLAKKFSLPRRLSSKITHGANADVRCVGMWVLVVPDVCVNVKRDLSYGKRGLKRVAY